MHTHTQSEREGEDMKCGCSPLIQTAPVSWSCETAKEASRSLPSSLSLSLPFSLFLSLYLNPRSLHFVHDPLSHSQLPVCLTTYRSSGRRPLGLFSLHLGLKNTFSLPLHPPPPLHLLIAEKRQSCGRRVHLCSVWMTNPEWANRRFRMNIGISRPEHWTAWKLCIPPLLNFRTLYWPSDWWEKQSVWEKRKERRKRWQRTGGKLKLQSSFRHWTSGRK